MNDIQVIESAQQITSRSPQHRAILLAMVNSTRDVTPREKDPRIVARIGQLLERPPSPVYYLWQRVKSGEAEALHVRYGQHKGLRIRVVDPLQA